MKKTVLLQITGYVQGVGLRYSVYQKAYSLNLKGYAKNLYDGSVQVIAEGDEDSIKELIKFIKKDLKWARVDNVNETWVEYKGEFSSFQIL